MIDHKHNSTIEVAGLSPVLRALVDSCLASSPWLKFEGNGFRIDWPLALARRSQKSGQDMPPQRLVDMLNSLLPFWSFEWLAQDSRSRRHSGHSLEAQVATEPLKLTDENRELMVELREAIAQVTQRIDEIAQKQKISSRQHLLEARKTLNQIMTSSDINDCEISLAGRYYIERRLAIGRADLIPVLMGESGHYISNRKQNLGQKSQVWDLCQKHIREQADFFCVLESYYSATAEGCKPLSLSDARLQKSLVQLAAREKHLAYTLSSDVAEKSGRHFAELTLKCRAPQTAGKLPERQFFNPFDYNQYPSVKDLPFQAFINKLQPAHGIAHTAKLVAQDDELGRRLTRYEKAANAIQFSLIRLRKNAEQDVPFHAFDLEQAIDWLIADSPLLLLITAGVLKPYARFRMEQNQEHISYGIGLSPWLTATILSKKILGVLPMTYLGLHGSQEDDGDSPAADNDALQAYEEPLIGRRVWEAVMNSLS